MSSIEARHEQALRRFYNLFQSEAFRQGDFSALDEILAPSFTDHDLVPGQGPGVQGLKDAFAGFYQAFPDFNTELKDIVVQGNKAAVCFQISGSQLGHFMGVPPTGKRFSAQAMGFICSLSR
ncbi:MAG: ester cyclase [Caldilinea sp. CFX5]|nr:ester cyclase [Caldilinea sp. CFX5]